MTPVLNLFCPRRILFKKATNAGAFRKATDANPKKRDSQENRDKECPRRQDSIGTGNQFENNKFWVICIWAGLYLARVHFLCDS